MTRCRRRVGAGLIVTALSAAAIGLSTDLDSPPRYDGAGYSVLAWSLRTGQGYREIDQPESPPHTHFPPGYPLALAGLWSVSGRSVAAAHLFSIACTVTAVGLAWFWLRRSEPPIVANLLAVALAVNATWAVIGGAIQSEPLYLLLSLMVLVRVKRSGGIVLGLLLGACVLTRHVGIGLVVAVMIDRLMSRRWREAGSIGLVSALVVLPWILWLVVARRATQAGLLPRSGWVSLILDQTIFYARRLPDVLIGPYVEVATVFGRSRVVASVGTLAAVLVSLVILAGLVRASFDPRKRFAGLIPLVTLPLLMVWPFTEAGRFLVPLVPCLLVGMVEGMSWILGRIRMRTPHPNPPPQGGRGSESPSEHGKDLERFPYDSGRPRRVGTAHPSGAKTETETEGGGRCPPYYENSYPPSLWGRAGWRARPSYRTISAFLILLATLPYSSYALVSGRAKAQRQTHADFDAACAWIKTHASQAGPILTRHPGEVFWQTGRKAIAPSSEDVNIVIDQIREQNTAYIIVDPERFANAPPTPLTRLTQGRPDLFRRVREGSVSIYEVIRERKP